MNLPITSVSAEAVSSRFLVRIGGLEFRWERVKRSAALTCDRSSSTGIAHASRPMLVLRRGLATVTLVLIGAAMIAVAAGRESHARRTPHRVTQLVPEQPESVKAIVGPARASGGSRAWKPVGAGVPVSSPVPVGNGVQAVMRITASEDVEAPSDALEERISNDSEGAMALALASGRMQQWRSPDGVVTGFVVAGELEGDAPGCRALSVLTRSDGGDRVTHHRRCIGEKPAGDPAGRPETGLEL